MLNSSIQYKHGKLHIDDVAAQDIVASIGSPSYVYSLKRIVNNFETLKTAFAALTPHIHYSAKANGNLAVIQALIEAGAGIDAVSGGEIYRALIAGATPDDIVFAGVGKTPDELRFAVEQNVGWINIENVDECRILNKIAGENKKRVRVALRFNPDVQANTHPKIATGHKGAKFGLNADDLKFVLAHHTDYPNLSIEGLHVHIGSQLGDTSATEAGIRTALNLIAPYSNIQTINIGGGFPIQYADGSVPSFNAFADVLTPLLKGYQIVIEPGRSIVADAGVLLTKLLYVKEQGGEKLYIVDASMTELMRPALYNAHHEIVSLMQADDDRSAITVVGPVCETTDVLRRDVPLPALSHGDLLAILDAGAYGMVMANTYNQRPRPAEVVVSADGVSWRVARRRETLADLLRYEEEIPETKTPR